MSLLLVITSKGLDKLPAKMRKFKLGVLARIPLMLKQMGEEVSTRAVEDYLSGPRPKKLGRVSGDLARSINYKVIGNRVVIGSNLPYAPVHEFGATIRAKASPFLVFKIGKSWASKKAVVIPPRPFLRPALKDAGPAMTTIVARMTNQALQEAMA